MDNQTQLEALTRRLELLEKQNAEARHKRAVNKQWKNSYERRFLVIFLRYFIFSSAFLAIGIDQPFIKALIPALAFIPLSILIPLFKKMWQKRNKNYNSRILPDESPRKIVN